MKYGVMTLKLNELFGTTAHLTGLNNINILVGRNGSGKSRFFAISRQGPANVRKNFMSGMSVQRELGHSSVMVRSLQI